MDNFDLKKYLAEGKLLKEDLKLLADEDYIELFSDSGEYFGDLEDNNKVSFSVMDEDIMDEEGIKFDKDNWKDILGSDHAFVKIAEKIPTEVEALEDYVMITVDLEDLKKITTPY